MNALIEKLEAATGPSRVTDVEIHLAVYGNITYGFKGPAHAPTPSTLAEYLEAFRSVIDADDAIPDEIVPRYTSSLDGAVKLIPEDLYWMAGHGRTRETEPFGGCVIVHPDRQYDPVSEAEANTPALAICIAALQLKAKG